MVIWNLIPGQALKLVTLVKHGHMEFDPWSSMVSQKLVTLVKHGHMKFDPWSSIEIGNPGQVLSCGI